MIMAKKIILGITIFIRLNAILFVMFIIGECLWFISPKVTEPDILSYEYYQSEEHINSEPFILFSKYYYEELGKISNDDYKLVEKNVEMIKDYISTSLSNFEKIDNKVIEFNYENITSNDSYFLEYIKDEQLLILHYYDEDERILYKTYVPIKNRNIDRS